jgi:hypothetical protein
MASRKIVLISILFLMFLTCNSQNKNPKRVVRSIWEKKGTFCFDSLILYNGGIYQEYYCEFNEYVNGQYSIRGDTLILVEYRLSSELMTKNPKPIPTYVWKYLFFNQETLHKIYYENIINKRKSFNGETWKYCKIKR